VLHSHYLQNNARFTTVDRFEGADMDTPKWKVLLYLDEMITPTGQVQHLDFAGMRKMVKMDLRDT